MKKLFNSIAVIVIICGIALLAQACTDISIDPVSISGGDTNTNLIQTTGSMPSNN